MTARPRAAGVTFTARNIALAVHCLRRSRHLRGFESARQWLATPDVEAELIRRTAGRERRMLRWLRVPPIRAALLAAIDLRIPGTTRHLLARKLWFHQRAREFLSGDEPRQVVILGAGLDGLGIRLAAAHEHATILECDRHGPMQLKQEFCGTMPQPRFVACDLAGDLTVGSPFDELDPERPTLILAEALFMYLPPARVRELLTAAARTLRGPIRLAFSYLDVGTLADPVSPIARLGRTLTRGVEPEPFLWSTVAGAIPGLLGSLGYALEETFDAPELRTRTGGGGRRGRAYGEWFATARRRPAGS